MKNEIRTRMQYPFDLSGKNPAYDGEVHDIKPTSIRRINLLGRDYFIMEYFDYNTNGNMVTLLTRVGNTLVKVPLTDYVILLQYIETTNLPYEDMNRFLFPEKIMLGETLDSHNLFAAKMAEQQPPAPAQPAPVDALEFTQYIPLMAGWEGSLRGSYYRSCGVLLDEPQTYHFDKDYNFDRKDAAVKSAIDSLPRDDGSMKEKDIVVEVPEGTIGHTYIFDNDGKGKVVQVYLIPGIHKYHLVFSQVATDNDYVASRMASSIDIKAPSSDYRDVHDYARAFNDGCNGILPTEYFNHSGKSILKNEVQRFGSY